MPPGRISCGSSWTNATMVLSMPTSHAPPSTIIATFVPRSSRTCRAVVGEIRPKRLAEGAAMPRPPACANACSNACATGCDGTRRPTLSWPPVTASDTCDARGTMMVSGPGQKASATRRAPRGIARAHVAASRASLTWTMTGWSAGRPFVAKIARTASSLPASAPSP
jgi:hypothetical protein